jgi:chromosome segregation ATPase
MSPTRARRVAAAALVAGTFALAGCGSGSTSDGSSSGGSSAGGSSAGTPTDATVAWADSVCSSLMDVKTAIGAVGDDLSVNPLSGNALEETRQQIAANLEDVQTAVDDLKAAIAAAPKGEGSQEVKSAFEAAMNDLESAQQTASEQAQAATSAQSVPEFVTAAAGALGAVQSAGSAVGQLYSTATDQTSAASAEVRAAFDSAPACQSLNG